MTKKILPLIVFLFLIHLSYAQSAIDQQALAEVVIRDASEMASLLNKADFKGFLKYIHPVRINAAGGEAKMIMLLNNQNARLKSKGVVINSTVFDQPSEIVKCKNELQCTISQHTELKPAKGRIVTHTTLLAISNDNGKSWKFVDANNMEITIVRKLFPDLSPTIILPPKQQPTVYTE